MDDKQIAEVRIVPNGKNSPTGKLASAEIVFTGGLLEGLRLVGFGIWAKGDSGKSVTLPARQYVVGGQPRVFPLLQPTSENGSQNRLRQAILLEYAAHEAARNPAETDDEVPDIPRP
jgi:hypothetical protein